MSEMSLIEQIKANTAEIGNLKRQFKNAKGYQKLLIKSNFNALVATTNNMIKYQQEEMKRIAFLNSPQGQLQTKEMLKQMEAKGY